MGLWDRVTGRSVRAHAMMTANTMQHSPAILESMTEQGMGTDSGFSPGQPLPPVQYREPPRRYDYQTGANIITQPRLERDRPTFDTLRELFTTYDIAQLCVAERVNQFRAMEWRITGVDADVDADDEILKATELVRKPDGITPWGEWVGKYLTDVFKYDAGCVYRTRNLDGTVRGLQVIDGTTIAPLVNGYGTKPEPPAYAYIQFIQGMAWDGFTTDDIIYRPFWGESNSVYGYPPLEKIMLNVNLDIRHQWYWLQTFAENTVPAGFMTAPPDLSSPEQIREWQTAWDAYLLGDQAKKTQLRWVPAGTGYISAKPTEYDKTFAEFLLVKTAAMFGVTPSRLGVTADVNRATGEVQQDIDQQSQLSLVRHVEELINTWLWDDMGLTRARFVIDVAGEEEDRLNVANAHNIYLRAGVLSIDEIRSQELGYPVGGTGSTPRFIETGGGLVPVDTLGQPVEEPDDIGPPMVKAGGYPKDPPPWGESVLELAAQEYVLLALAALEDLIPNVDEWVRNRAPVAKQAASPAWSRFLSAVWGRGALEANRQALDASMTVLDWGSFWDSWTPGDQVAATVVKDSGLRTMLNNANITIKSIQDNQLERLGTVLSDSLKAGDALETTVQLIRDALGDIPRATMIARTELCRAATQASLGIYYENGVTRWEWLTASDPCPACAELGAGGPYTLQDEAPPLHPHCLCAVAPLVEIGDETVGE